jgi:23S rRNA (cytidine1920-2'-O)/16S rRNA (cytidine1409-2'-O)-methyltransferase
MSDTFVSRAGEKLDYAIIQTQTDVTGKVCADFGSSTGGFVDCLLVHGAERVYSVDTAYGELAWSLRNNPRVIVMERTNALHVMLPEPVEVITNDTSWTKQALLLPAVTRNLLRGGLFITLIKPHYESGNAHLNEEESTRIARTVADQIRQEGFEEQAFLLSPLKGKKGGNSEFIAVFRRG